MKTICYTAIVALLILFIFGFVTKESDQFTDKQQDQIKKEIITIGDSIMARLERLDTEGALQYYSPDFVGFGLGGDQFNLQEYVKYCADIFNSATLYKWTPYRLDFIVITKDIVVVSQDGRNETIMKSGAKLIFDPSHYTFAFKKIEGQWKLFYHHFSGTYMK
jgi:hypothetical protein